MNSGSLDPGPRFSTTILSASSAVVRGRKRPKSETLENNGLTFENSNFMDELRIQLGNGGDILVESLMESDCNRQHLLMDTQEVGALFPYPGRG